ncbi:MAG: Maf family nucleotide pyrophosphatase [Roseburia sp.]|nr:Maf family nucleotide pyrophosphatase [Roseburia sp.]MCM1099000.1 Maf family nucleotide pyrophosphatase [Ruminococcus flavefaciens]
MKIYLASASPRRKELLAQIGLEFEVKVSNADERIIVSEPWKAVEELSARKAEAVLKELSARKAEAVLEELSARKAEAVLKELSARKAETVSGELSVQKAETVSGELSARKAETVSGELSARRAETVSEELLRRESGIEPPGFSESGAGTPHDILVIGADTVVAIDGTILGKPADREQAEKMLTELAGRTHQVYTGVTLLYRNAEGEVTRKTFHEMTRVSFYPMSRKEIARYLETGDGLDKAGAYGIQGFCARYIQGIEGDYNNVVGLPVGRLYQEAKEWLGE